MEMIQCHSPLHKGRAQPQLTHRPISPLFSLLILPPSEFNDNHARLGLLFWADDVWIHNNKKAYITHKLLHIHNVKQGIYFHFSKVTMWS